MYWSNCELNIAIRRKTPVASWTMFGKRKLSWAQSTSSRANNASDGNSDFGIAIVMGQRLIAPQTRILLWNFFYQHFIPSKMCWIHIPHIPTAFQTETAVVRMHTSGLNSSATKRTHFIFIFIFLLPFSGSWVFCYPVKQLSFIHHAFCRKSSTFKAEHRTTSCFCCHNLLTGPLWSMHKPSHQERVFTIIEWSLMIYANDFV